MANMSEAARQLRDALAEVPNLQVPLDVGPGVDPPAAVVGPPSLEWQGTCSGPTSGRYLVWLVVAGGEGAVEQLLALLPQVTEVLDDLDDAVVVRADPGSYPGSNGDLPAYEIQVDVALS